MRPDSRLNLLLTPPPAPKAVAGAPLVQAWHQTVSRLLVPLGVRTFEANSGTEAMELIERHPIHLAVVDTRLPSISGMNVLQLIQRLRERGQHLTMPPAPLQPPPSTLPGPPAASPAVPSAASPSLPAPSAAAPAATEFRFHMKMEEKMQDGQRRIEVRIDAQVGAPRACGPVVILIAPPPEQQDVQLMQEALKFNAFSVLTEPVDVNVALDVMARAMKRWFSGQWPC